MTEVKKIINGDLLSTGLNQLWRIISGPITLVMIPIYLTPEAQGYWYMFTSLAALAIFADLGFSNIILQFAAHEFAYLKFDANKKIIGDETHLKRLASFFRFSVKWLGIVIGVVFPSIIFIGYYYLSGKETTIAWGIPWVIYSTSSGIVFLYSSILYFFEGCNSVSRVQLIRAKIAIATSITTLLGLYFGIQLYALSCSLMISATVGLFLLFQNFGQNICHLWEVSRVYSYSWFREFFSLLWRYAISWCSGYFIFQLFTPLTFHFYGAVEAGKIGISIALWTAGFSIANIWIVAITPKINMLISIQKWKELNNLFYENLKRSIITFLFGIIVFFGTVSLLNDYIDFFSRFVSSFSMGILALSWMLQLIINALAVYLRAHKMEPLMEVSLFSAIYVFGTTYFCARYLDPQYLFIGYLSQYVFVLPYVMQMFFKHNKQHE